jgi:hypothetical protein
MISGIPSTDHISSLTHLLHSHLDEELGAELNRAGLDSRLSALPVCPKMRLGERTMPGVPCGESGSPSTDRLPDAGGQEPPAGGQQEGTDTPRGRPDAQVLRAGGPLPTPRAAAPAPASRR